MAARLLEQATDEKLFPKGIKALVKDNLLDDVRLWFEKRIEGLQFVPASKETGLGGQINFLAVQLEAKVSTETLTRQTLRERISLHLSELLERMRYVIDEVERNGQHQVLFIVEDIDKLNLANTRDLFLEHAWSLTTVPASIIYTFPIALRNSLDWTHINASFGRHYVLPPVKLYDQAGNPNSEGDRILREVFLLRLDASLIETEALSTIIAASGGLIGTLVRLGQWAAEHALVDGKTVIDVPSADQAIAEMRGDFKALLRLQDYEVLRQQVKGEQLTNEEAVREALYTGCLLEYLNGEPWFRIHPIVQPLIERSHAMIDLVTAPTSPAAHTLLSGGNGLPAEVSPREFERLTLLLNYAERGAWAFCVYNVATVRDAVVDQLRLRLNPLPVYEFTLSGERPNPRDYLDHLPAGANSQRAVIIFYDAWRAFEAGFFGYLDLQREQFWRAPHSLVFWIRDADRARLARQAPNFFSRHSGVFDFQVVIPYQADMLRSQSAALPAAWDSVAERERLERLYIGLLYEYESDPEPDQAVIGDLLGKLASIWYYSDRFDQAEAALHRRLRIAQEIQDRQSEADSRLQIGRIRQFQDDLAGAGEAYRAALADFQAIGDRLGAANTRKALGDLALRQADLAAAGEQYRAALADHEAIGDRLGAANTRKALGDLALRQDDLAAAGEQYRAALADHEAIGDRLGAANTRKALGDLALRQDDLAAAGEQYRAALADFQAIGARLGAANAYFGLGELSRTSMQFDQAAEFYNKALAEQRAIGARLGQANTIDSLGELAEAQEQWETARDHFAAALQIYWAIGNSYANVTARNLARVEARFSGTPAPDEGQQAVERLLAQWQPVVQAVVAAARGDKQALQQVNPLLQQLNGSPDWGRLASALQQLVAGERDAAVLARKLDETDRLILAATLASLG